MYSDTGRDQDGPGFDQYWRRRAAVLAGVVGAVAVFAWACSGDDEPERVRHAGATTAPAVPAAMPTVTVTTTVKATETPGAGAVGPGGACDPKALVVSMRATDSSFGAGERPRFLVTAVNTGSRTCVLDAGPGKLGLSITSGSDDIWSSAACARSSGSSRPKLRRGVPYVRTITWDRKRASGDCEGRRPLARPGTYVATFESRTLKAKAPRQVFTLR
jgi:hypothetical protein